MNTKVEGGADPPSESPKDPPPSPATDTGPDKLELRVFRTADQIEELRVPILPSCFEFSELVAATGNLKSCALDYFYGGHLEDGQVSLPRVGLIEQFILDIVGGVTCRNNVVAVKRLKQDSGAQEFLTQVFIVSQLNHPNIVKLIGYCTYGDDRYVVYELMPLGSLRDHLHDLPPNKEPLDWNTRMKIAEGVARGLEYLHKMNPPVIYRFISSSNILLGEGYHSKLSDVGVERFCPTHAMTEYGYHTPEDLLVGEISVKSDVYSFGVLLLELVTGRKAIDIERCHGEQLLVAWACWLLTYESKVMHTCMADPLLQDRYPLISLYQALSLASQCLNSQAEHRPPIEYIVDKVSQLASQTYGSKTAPA